MQFPVLLQDMYESRSESRIARGMTITAAQCRAARAMLQWSVRALAEKAGVRPATISNFETGKSSPNRSTRAAIQRALEAAGIEFTNGAKPGVRLSQNL
jgi:transcriptional regulator with XRE-family HTH domain